MAAGISLRISDDPTGRRAGVDRQEQDCRALCASRGWRVEDVYIDNDISAYSGKRRPEYDRLCADIRTGRITQVVAWHPDRLHRSPRELEDFIDLIEACAIPVANVMSGEWDLTTASGRLNARLLGAVARYESEHKSDRVRRALRQNAEQGKAHGGGRRRYGYQPNGTDLHPAEATLLRTAARRLLAGDTLRAVCADFTAADIPTIDGGTWHPSVLRRTLSHPRIAGLRVHRGDILGDAAWPAILDPDTWHALRALFADPTRRDATTNTRVHLLSNLARCGMCDSGLLPHHSRQRGEKVLSYSCQTEGCRKVIIRHHLLEDAVVAALHTWLDRSHVVPAAPDEPADDLAQRIAAVEAQIGAADRAMEADETMTFERLAEITRGLTRRLTGLRAEQARRQQTSVVQAWAGRDSRAAWEDATLERRRALVAAVFARIAVHRARDPQRLELAFRD